MVSIDPRPCARVRKRIRHKWRKDGEREDGQLPTYSSTHNACYRLLNRVVGTTRHERSPSEASRREDLERQIQEQGTAVTSNTPPFLPSETTVAE